MQLREPRSYSTRYCGNYQYLSRNNLRNYKNFFLTSVRSSFTIIMGKAVNRMTLEEQLKDEILSRYKSIRAFTTAINIPYSTLDSVFKRGIPNAGVSTMIKVFSALDLDIESISSGELCHRNAGQKEFPATTETDPLRSTLLHNFDQLNREGRERLVETSDDMVSSGKYIKSDTGELGKAQGA